MVGGTHDRRSMLLEVTRGVACERVASIDVLHLLIYRIAFFAQVGISATCFSQLVIVIVLGFLQGHPLDVWGDVCSNTVRLLEVGDQDIAVKRAAAGVLFTLAVSVEIFKLIGLGLSQALWQTTCRIKRCFHNIISASGCFFHPCRSFINCFVINCFDSCFQSNWLVLDHSCLWSIILAIFDDSHLIRILFYLWLHGIFSNGAFIGHFKVREVVIWSILVWWSWCRLISLLAKFESIHQRISCRRLLISILSKSLVRSNRKLVSAEHIFCKGTSSWCKLRLLGWVLGNMLGNSLDFLQRSLLCQVLTVLLNLAVLLHECFVVNCICKLATHWGDGIVVDRRETHYWTFPGFRVIVMSILLGSWIRSIWNCILHSVLSERIARCFFLVILILQWRLLYFLCEIGGPINLGLALLASLKCIENRFTTFGNASLRPIC